MVWRQSTRFAMLARCLTSSFTCRFLFSSLESVVKSNVTVFVYVVVNFLSQVIFLFLLFYGMIMYANGV